MSREDAQMKIRLPADLKEKLEKSAVENKRSMNAEVLQRLTKSFEYDFFSEKLLEKEYVISDADFGEVSSATLRGLAKTLNDNNEILKKLNSQLKISFTFEDKEKD